MCKIKKWMNYTGIYSQIINSIVKGKHCKREKERELITKEVWLIKKKFARGLHFFARSLHFFARSLHKQWLAWHGQPGYLTGRCWLPYFVTISKWKYDVICESSTFYEAYGIPMYHIAWYKCYSTYTPVWRKEQIMHQNAQWRLL